MSDEKAEAGIEADPARADSRAKGGVANAEPDTGSTTGGQEAGGYVGRVAGQDVGYEEEQGAERRAEAD
jgi:hypothetical protein